MSYRDEMFSAFHVPINEATAKLIEILTFAKEHNSLVEFWFYRGAGK